jgi:hypothetical protein
MIKITAILEPIAELVNSDTQTKIKHIVVIKPTNRTDAIALHYIKKDIPVSISIGQYRRPDRNRAWWTALAFFAENCQESDQWQGKTKEWLHNAVQLSIGHTEVYQLDDRTVEVPKGTAFDKIPDEGDYTEHFFNPATEYLANRMGYFSRSELFDAIRQWEHT